MLNPAIGKLIEMYDSRYQLVHDVADRARKIVVEAEEEKEILVNEKGEIIGEKLRERV